MIIQGNKMGTLKRIGIYIAEMYPLQHALLGLVMTFAYFIALSRLNDFDFLYTPMMLFAALSMVLCVLLIRIIDDLKDYDDDLVNYPNRPLPSGRVTKDDLKRVSFYLVVTILVLNLGSLAMLGMISVVLLYSLLIFYWFFAEKKIRADIGAALISHHPIVYIFFLYLSVAFCNMFRGVDSASFWLIIPLAFTVTTWEISRKIKEPSHEDNYLTYSKVWGAKISSIAALCSILITIVGMNIYLALVGAPFYFALMFSLLSSLVTIPYVIYFTDQKIIFKQAHLRLFAEALMVLVALFIFLEFFVY